MIDHSIRTRPVAVISSNHENGTIITLSNEAKKEGLFRGMKVNLARKMSQSIQLIPYNRNLYQHIHKNIIKTFHNYTHLFESGDYGQYYLDMSGTNQIYKCMNDVGNKIIKNVYSKTSMRTNVGISSNKLISKISTKVVPETIWQVENGNESKFISPLPPRILPLCNEISVKKIIQFLMINSIHQMQEVFKNQQLASILFSNLYLKLNQQVFGKDNSPVLPQIEKYKITKQKVLLQNSNDYHLLKGVIRDLSGEIGYKLRKLNRSAKHLSIEIHYSDGFLNKDSCKLNSNNDYKIIKISLKLFNKVFKRRNRIRSIIMTVTNLFFVNNQLSLFEHQNSKFKNISTALDIIRKKFGRNIIYNGFSPELYSKLNLTKR